MAMKNRQVELATKMAMAKERLKYYSVFVGLVWLVVPIAAYHHHKPQMLAALVPVSISWAFQYDMAYGTMMFRAQKEASRTIKDEPERFFLPEGSGIVDQKGYNKIFGLPENYKPKL